MPLPTLVLRAPSHAQLSLTPLRRATIVQPWIKIAPDLSTACRSRWTSWVLPEPTTARLWPRLDTTNSSPDVEIGTRVLQLLLVSSWLLFRFLRQRLAELPGTDLAIFIQTRFPKLLVLHLLLLLVALDLNFFAFRAFLAFLTYLFCFLFRLTVLGLLCLTSFRFFRLTTLGLLCLTFFRFVFLLIVLSSHLLLLDNDHITKLGDRILHDCWKRDFH